MMEVTDVFYFEMKMTISNSDFSILFDNEYYDNVGYIEVEQKPHIGDFEYQGKCYLLIMTTDEPRPYRFFIRMGEFSMSEIPNEFYEVGRVWTSEELIAYSQLEGRVL